MTDENTEEEIPQYEVDDDTQMLLREAIEMISFVSELQATDESRSQVQNLAESIAQRFGISMGTIQITENEEGGLSFTLEDGETSGTLDISNLDIPEEHKNDVENEELTDKPPSKEDTVH